MLARAMPLMLMSFLLCACGDRPVQLTRPVPVKVELPPNLRGCADQAGTDPTTFRTRGDVMLGYGNERTLRLEVQDCLRETIRLVDFQNENAGAPVKAAGDPAKPSS